MRAEGVKPAVVIGRQGRHILFILPLALEAKKALRRVTWLGAFLNSSSAPLLASDFNQRVDPAQFVLLWREIVSLLRGRLAYDLLDLNKIPMTVGGQANPMLALSVTPHPNDAYVMNLSGTWDEIYHAKNSASSRKTDLRKRRRLDKLGTVRFETAVDRADVERTLDTLMAQKKRLYAQLGVADIFEFPGYRDFFLEIASRQDLVHVSSITIDDKIIAASFGLTFHGNYDYVVAGYDNIEFEAFSPGAIHLQELIRHFLEHGFKTFDFNIGDEPYKRRWFDLELMLYDYLAPASSVGVLAAASIRAFPGSLNGSSSATRRSGRCCARQGRWWRRCGRVRMSLNAETLTMPGRLAQFIEPGRLRRLWLPLTLIALRGLSIVAKFLLALYTARYLGLADLGIYGLVVGATLLTPACSALASTTGFCTIWWRSRAPNSCRARNPGLPSPWACTPSSSRSAGRSMERLGRPIPYSLAVPIAIILLLEHLSVDVSDVLIARGRALMANLCGFFRAGLWPPIAIGVGLYDPRAQTISWLLAAWAGILILMWLILGAQLLQHGRWRHVGLRMRWIGQGVRESANYYVKDISNVISLTADRFLISLFLGLELTGVYTFLWSMANVMQGLVVFGTVQPHVPELVEANSRSRAEFHALERRLIVETLAWTGVVAAAICVVTPFLLPFMHRPLLEANLPVFWLIVAATVARIGSDSYTFVLVALKLDRATAAISIAGAVGSAALNVLLLPLAGLYGAALAYLMSASGLLAARFIVSRAKPPGNLAVLASSDPNPSRVQR
ncbi:MAG: GNAT family N-acetyltransferase [Pseudolabrys sp.]